MAPFIQTPGQAMLGPGHSITIVRNDTGASVTLDGLRTRFESSHEDELVKTSPIDGGGVVTGMTVPGGESGMIEVEKATDDFTALMAFLDQNYYTAPQTGNNPQIYFTITENYTTLDGQAKTYQFQSVKFHGYKRGTWERASTVKPSVNFFASMVVPV